MEFKDRLQQAMDERGLKAADLSRMTGIGEGAISQYRRGAYKAGQRSLEKIANALNVSIPWLMGMSDDPAGGDGAFCAPVTTDNVVTFPVIGDVAAGYEHIMSEDWSGDTIEVPASYLHGRPRSDYFCLRVKGDSMYPLYLDGDRVLVLKADTLQHSGEIGVVRYNGDMATLKKVEYVMGEDWMRLVPLNLAYQPQMITGCDLEQCSIIGIPKLVVREV